MAFEPQTSVALEGCTHLVPRSVPTRKVVALVDRSWDDPGRDYELDRLCAAAPELGVDLRVVDIQDLELLLNGDRLEIRELCSPVPPSARVLVRLGARATDHQLAVLRILESLGVEMEATPAAIRVTQHKLLTAFEVSDLVLTPKTLLTSNPFDDATRDFYFGDNWPIVLKVPIGTNGDDVEPVFDAAEYADACLHEQMADHEALLVQRFIGDKDSPNDVRVMFIGEPVAAMRRFAGHGERVTNIARGGRGVQEELSPELIDLSYRICGRLGLEIAGLDFLFTDDGEPVLLEVNSAPGFRGLEACTGLDVATRMLEWINRG